MKEPIYDWLDRLLNLTKADLTYRERGNLRLTGKIMFAALAMFIFFLFYNLFNGVRNVPYVLYPAYFLLVGVCVFLIRSANYVTAKFIFIVGIILLVFSFAITSPQQTGMQQQLLLAIVATVALFSGDRNRVIYLVIFVIFVCYMLSAFPGFNPLPRRVLSFELIQRYFLFFTIFFFVISYLTVWWLVKLHKSFEKELGEQKGKLEDVNNNLNRIVYTVSHDLRAPLNSLQGLIAISKHATSDKERAEYTGMMEKQIVSMKTYIQDVVDYNRNEKTSVDELPVDIGDLVTEIVNTLKDTGGGNLKIENTISKGTTFKSDPVRLKAIFSNLIGNAIKYCDLLKPQQEVKIEAKTEPNWLHITVSDNGLGIGQEHLPRLFEMFYRATDKREGTGLGLYIVYETLQKLGGKISVTSELGKGSVFIVSLPT